ncbi:MAG: c-type cytochrome [Candidatus Eisenbacteria bacterium]
MKRLCIAWLVCVVAAAIVAGCGGAPKSGIARGDQLYDTCVPCHGEAGRGNRDLGAPSIAGLPQWYIDAQLIKFSKGIRGAHPADMEGARMRPMARTLKNVSDVASVAEYVAKLAPYRPDGTLTGGDADAGKVRYDGLCVTCHGAEGKGNQDLGSPDLTHQADWYMLAQLNKFKGGMRGAHPDDVQGQQMAAMSQTLEDEKAMKDVIAYIRSLRP